MSINFHVLVASRVLKHPRPWPAFAKWLGWKQVYISLLHSIVTFVSFRPIAGLGIALFLAIACHEHLVILGILEHGGAGIPVLSWPILLVQRCLEALLPCSLEQSQGKSVLAAIDRRKNQ